MMSMDSIMFDEKREFTLYKELQFKVVRFAMDKIRLNTLKYLKDDFVTRGDNCNCWDRVVYKLSCPCIIAKHQNVLPLDLIHRRWMIELDEDEIDEETGKSSFCEGCRVHL